MKAKELANGACGLSDGSKAGQWRLPSIVELESLIDLSKSGSALPQGHPFVSLQNSSYWTSSVYASMSGYAWVVSLSTGTASGINKIFANDRPSNFVWFVRNGP